MTDAPVCRQCSECDGQHHFGDLYREPCEKCDDFSCGECAELGCKHCDAIADRCEECEFYEDDEVCKFCLGRRVVNVRVPGDSSIKIKVPDRPAHKPEESLYVYGPSGGHKTVRFVGASGAACVVRNPKKEPWQLPHEPLLQASGNPVIHVRIPIEASPEQCYVIRLCRHCGGIYTTIENMDEAKAEQQC